MTNDGNKLTIVGAIKEVLSRSGIPLTPKEVYEKIIDFGLYNFGAKEPKNVVLGEIRKHCVGLDFPSASPVKYFKIAYKDGKIIKYFLKDDENNNRDLSPTFDLTDQIPEETIYKAYLEHRNAIKQQLLSTII